MPQVLLLLKSTNHFLRHGLLHCFRVSIAYCRETKLFTVDFFPGNEPETLILQTSVAPGSANPIRIRTKHLQWH